MVSIFMLSRFLSTFTKESKILEDESVRYMVTLPKRPAVDIRIDKKLDELEYYSPEFRILWTCI